MRYSRKGKNHSALWRRVVLIVCGTILGVNVYWFNATQLAGNDLPMPFGVGVAVVLSGSMEPTMSKGDLIVVAKNAEFQVGDCVVFQSGADMIVHRVIAMDESAVFTQGDANSVPDRPVEYSAVRGKVVVCIPGIGNLVQFLRTPVGIILILATAFGLTELSYRRERSRDDEELEDIKDEIRRLRAQQEANQKEQEVTE